MLIHVLILTIVTSKALSETEIEQFEEFITEHNKIYKNEEEKQMRFEIFNQNLKEIKAQNEDPDEEAEFGITPFTDLTREEFIQMYTGYIPSGKMDGIPIINASIITDQLPDTFDWRDKNVVSRVKSQGACGSCWAFSAIGCYESHYAIKHHKIVEFSEQQLVDCNRNSVNKGCGGGDMILALRYIKDKGIMTEKAYPYTARDDNCKYNASFAEGGIEKVIAFNTLDEEVLRHYLYKNGPLVIGIDASDLRNYRKHIYKTCKFVKLNHGVLLVGYGVENDTPYWIIKNSWGDQWGDNGYFRLKRGINGCGLLEDNIGYGVPK